MYYRNTVVAIITVEHIDPVLFFTLTICAQDLLHSWTFHLA